MKANILYAGLFILAVVIIFIMVFGSGKAPEISKPVALKGIQIGDNSAAVESSIVALPVFNRQAITVIKPAQKINPVISSEDISMSNSRQGSYDTIVRSANAGGSAEIQDEVVITSGVTRTEKYPTKEKTKEMNSKGIVLY